MFLYPILGFATAFYLFKIICALSRPGTSTTLFKQVCVRYFLYFVFMAPFYGEAIFQNLGFIINFEDTMMSGFTIEVQQILAAFSFLQTSIRIFEPFVFKTFRNILIDFWKDVVKACKCCKKKKRPRYTHS